MGRLERRTRQKGCGGNISERSVRKSKQVGGDELQRGWGADEELWRTRVVCYAHNKGFRKGKREEGRF